jgi:hypothetical protein
MQEGGDGFVNGIDRYTGAACGWSVLGFYIKFFKTGKPEMRGNLGRTLLLS